MINFYAQGETDGIAFEVYFSAENRKKAEAFAKKVGWKLVGQEMVIDDMMDEMLIELTMPIPRLH